MRGLPQEERLPPTARRLAGCALACVLVLAVPASAHAQCAAPAFELPPATIDVGTGPRGVAVLDLKHDGALDLVTADDLSNSVTFAFGNGAGGFAGTLSQSVGAGPVAVTVADFDRDGFDDVAVANATASTVQAVLLSATGTVKLLANTVSVVGPPSALVAGHFDGDGIPDLVSASSDLSGTVEFLKGSGTGTFTRNLPTSQFLVGGRAQDLAAGDFNRDGKLDVVVVTQNLPANPRVHVVLGRGDGTWDTVSSFSVAVALSGQRPIALAMGDVDNDGDLDVVTADSASPDIVVLLQNSLGNLVAQPRFFGSFPTTSVVLADFDSNGVLDLGVARELSNGVSAFTGDGAGAFVSRREFSFVPLLDDARDLAVGDFDNDGRPDLAGSSRLTNRAVLLVNAFDPVCAKPSFARAGRLQVPLPVGTPAAIVGGDWDGDAIPDLAIANDDSIEILMGDGALSFGAPTPVALPLSAPSDRRSLVAADFNLDSRLDLATVNPTSGAANDDALSVLLNTGGGTFGPPLFLPLPVGADPSGVGAGDFNGDGAPDLVSADRGSSTLTFFPGRGDGTFGAPTTTALVSGNPTAIAVGDIDGDSRLDVAVTHGVPTDSVIWYRGDGAGGFTVGGTHPLGNPPWSVDLGDLNGDARPDMAVAIAVDDTVRVFINTGAAFGAPTTYLVGDEPYSVRIGRADADPDADLVVPNRSSYDVTVLFNDGSGGFPVSRFVRGYDQPSAALLVDADRNTKPDLAVVNWNYSGGVYVLPGDGAGGFGPVQVSPGTGAGSRSVASGDFDRDGVPDLVTLDQAVDALSYLKGLGDGTFAPPVTFPTGLGSPRGLGVGDFNTDGKLDVVVGGPGVNVALLPGNGTGGFDPTVTVPGTASGSSRYHVAVGDFDRDGRLDFTRITAGAVTTHYGDGTGGFVAELSTAVPGSPTDLVVLDFDRDGILDLAVSNFSTNTVWLLQGEGARLTPPFTRRVPDLVTDVGPTGLAVGDVDHDGVTDLVVGQLNSIPGKLGYFHGLIATAPPFFAARTDFGLAVSVMIQPDGVSLADVNADGLLDALVACRGEFNEERASVRVLTGTGNAAVFNAADVWAVAQRNPSVIEVADFNVDGKPDFATAEIAATTENRISVVLNSNCLSRRLRPNRNVSLCNTPLTPFAQQPAIQIEDDGANPIQCDAGPVAASIVPGTGTGGASLLGTTPLGPTNGVADWSTQPAPIQLSIDLAGTKYRLGFQHSLAGQTHSRTFSLDPPIVITGPLDYCADQPGLFSADTGFDTYRWFVGVAGPLGFAPDLTIPGSSFAPGGYLVQVQATADTCPAGANQPLTLYGNLTSVTVAPGLPVSVCGSCTGPTLTVAESGGGAVTRKWGYRTTPGVGVPTWIPAQTGTTYTVNGSDFPGQGTYYLLVETTPQCGTPTESNEVEVQVTTTATPADVVQVLTVRSTSGLNRLEWVYPAALNKVRIRYRTSPTWATCVPPESEGVGFSDIPDQTGVAGGKGFYDHGSLTDGTTYCYAVFAEDPPTSGTYSTNARVVKGRPFVTGAVAWAFSMGTMAMSPPGLGAGILHAVSNDEFLHSMVKAGQVGAGAWPSTWTPYAGNGPSQSRPSNVPYSPSPPNAVVYLGSQATAGSNAVGVDADTGAGLWGQPLGQPVQAGPAGIFTAFGGAVDAILLGTRDSGGNNAFHALDPANLNPLGGSWPYTGEALNEIGIVSAQAAVDYTTNTAIFTSYQYTPGTTDSVWCVDLTTAARCPLWVPGVSAGLGDIAAGPARRGARVYVAPISGVDAEIVALDASDGTVAWSPTFTPLDGQVKLFIVPDLFSPDLYFSTTGTVWSIRDDGAAASENWRRTTIPSPSQPVFFAGTGRVYVGGGDGKLYILDSATGLDAAAPITLGEPGFAVAGAPTVDQAGGYVYVGTDAGVVFAVVIP